MIPMAKRMAGISSMSLASDLKCFTRTKDSWVVTPNVRVNRTAAAGWLGPGWENVPRTPGRAKTARRSGSGGSTRC
jgi:hypothetical protein